jgi:exodeoxyribonuclease-3
MRIVSWNVNGLRAVAKKGFLDWLNASKADVVCLQEIKANIEQVPEEVRAPKGWHVRMHSAQKAGYSGTAIFSRVKPDEYWSGLDKKLSPESHDEGRVLAARYGNLHVLSCYFPNSQEGGKRQAQKLAYFDAMGRKMVELVKKGQQVVVTGDYNVAHNEIDLARPDDNHENPGFFPWEREAMTRFLALGFVDSFRQAHPGLTEQYTWWSFRTAARARNVGWRIDYCCPDEKLQARVKSTWIEPSVMGSDHCPVGIELK